MGANKYSFKFKDNCGNSFSITFGCFKYGSIITSQGPNAIKEFLDDTFSYNIPMSNTKVLASKLVGTSILGVFPSSLFSIPKSAIVKISSKRTHKKANGKYFCIFVKNLEVGEMKRRGK
jgi:hypothetical protein